jgi:RND family efflux transporter MFP subunit
MQLRIKHLCFGTSLLGLLLLTGCKEEKAAATPEPPKVTISKPIVRNNEIDTDEYNGWLVPKDRVEIRSRVRGFVKTVHFKDPPAGKPAEGELVKKGDPLFDLDPDPFKDEITRAQEKANVYRAQMVAAQRQLDRILEVQKKGGASQQEVDKADADVKSLEAQVKAQDTEVKLRVRDLEEYSKIKAPIDGRIGASLVALGELVLPGENLLATINSVDPIKVEFYADEQSVQRFRKQALNRAKDGALPSIKDAKVPFTFALDTDEGFFRKGVLDFADNQADPKTGKILVRGQTENPKRLLLAGDHVRVRVPLSQEYQAIMVPDTAVNTDQDKRYLLVLDDKNVVQRRDVRLGKLTDDGMRVIETNLNPNDRVVVEGTQRARVGSTVTPEEKDLAKELKAAQTPAGQ